MSSVLTTTAHSTSQTSMSDDLTIKYLVPKTDFQDPSVVLVMGDEATQAAGALVRTMKPQFDVVLMMDSQGDRLGWNKYDPDILVRVLRSQNEAWRYANSWERSAVQTRAKTKPIGGLNLLVVVQDVHQMGVMQTPEFKQLVKNGKHNHITTILTSSTPFNFELCRPFVTHFVQTKASSSTFSAEIDQVFSNVSNSLYASAKNYSQIDMLVTNYTNKLFWMSFDDQLHPDIHVVLPQPEPLQLAVLSPLTPTKPSKRKNKQDETHQTHKKKKPRSPVLYTITSQLIRGFDADCKTTIPVFVSAGNTNMCCEHVNKSSGTASHVQIVHSINSFRPFEICIGSDFVLGSHENCRGKYDVVFPAGLPICMFNEFMPFKVEHLNLEDAKFGFDVCGEKWTNTEVNELKQYSFGVSIPRNWIWIEGGMAGLRYVVDRTLKYPKKHSFGW